MNASQQRNWEAHRERYLVDVERDVLETSVAASQGPLEWDGIFGRSAPLLVEIGSGAGDSPVALAQARPEANIVAFEVYEPALATTVGKLARAELDHVRLLMADGQAGLEILFAPHCVSELRTYFPDPWQKKRHHKRRLVSTAFADVVAERLVPGGTWRLATDWPDYADAMREVLDAHPRFRNVYPEGAPRDPHRPVTRFEQRGIDAGREIVDFVYEVRA